MGAQFILTAADETLGCVRRLLSEYLKDACAAKRPLSVVDSDGDGDGDVDVVLGDSLDLAIFSAAPTLDSDSTSATSAHSASDLL